MEVCHETASEIRASNAGKMNGQLASYVYFWKTLYNERKALRYAEQRIERADCWKKGLPKKKYWKDIMLLITIESRKKADTAVVQKYR
jgi:hypothetical protein